MASNRREELELEGVKAVLQHLKAKESNDERSSKASVIRVLDDRLRDGALGNLERMPHWNSQTINVHIGKTLYAALEKHVGLKEGKKIADVFKEGVGAISVKSLKALGIDGQDSSSITIQESGRECRGSRDHDRLLTFITKASETEDTLLSDKISKQFDDHRVEQVEDTTRGTKREAFRDSRDIEGDSSSSS